jgi:hypothetical protein
VAEETGLIALQTFQPITGHICVVYSIIGTKGLPRETLSYVWKYLFVGELSQNNH